MQAAGRFADADLVYVISDVPLDLNEEVRAACYDLRVPLPLGDAAGRPPKDLTIPTAVALELQSTGVRPHAAEVYRRAHSRGWVGAKRTVETRWGEIEAVLAGAPAPQMTAPKEVTS